MAAAPGAGLDGLLHEQLSTWPGPAAVVVLDRSGPIGRAGEDAVYPWASVTKVLTALTVLQAVLDGVLDLDEPAGPPGATLRHLLAHASGLAVDDDRVLAAPGRRRIYSNRGIELAVGLLEERTGRPFEAALSHVLLKPLGMGGTRLAGSPAHGAHGPVADLARLAQELLAPTVLDPALISAAVTPTYPELSGVLPGFGRQQPNGWGLGVELRGAKAPHWTAPEVSALTFGHFGQSGSFLWVDPVAQLACVSAGTTPFGPWAAEAWPRLCGRVISGLQRS